MTKFKPMAFSPHNHAHMSLDGGGTEKQRIKRAIELGRSGDALTDHGVMSGLIPHWYAAKEIDPKFRSVHGIELYVIDERRPAKVMNKQGDTQLRYTHLTVLFKTRKAYEYFCSMTPIMESRAISIGGERKPLIYFHELEPIADEIVLGTGCLVSFVQKHLNDWNITSSERLQWAEEDYLRLKRLSGSQPLIVEVFGHKVTHNWSKGKEWGSGEFKPITEDNHICSHGCAHIEHIQDECGRLTIPVDLQQKCDEFILYMGEKHNDIIMFSEDSHLARAEDKIVQDARMGNWKFYETYSMESSDFWAEKVKSKLKVSDYDIEKWIDNSYLTLDWFSGYTVRDHKKDGFLTPEPKQVYDVRFIEGKDNKQILRDLIKKHGRMPTQDDSQYDVYSKRLEYEISIFADNGIVDLIPYWFPVEDAVSWAKENDVVVNVRGSAGGSLIAYLIGTSITDPIRYTLPVERMISVPRITTGSMPDADTDWEDRDDVLQYLVSKYGDCVSQIGTEMTLKVKSAILDAERYIKGAVSKETSKMCKMLDVPQSVDPVDYILGFTKHDGSRVPGIVDNLDNYAGQLLKKWIVENPEVWNLVKRFLGITKNRGVHAGGVLITPVPVSSIFPLMSSNKPPLACALNMKYTEQQGGIKYDFLGVKCLKALGIARRAFKKDHGYFPVWQESPHDPKVFEEVYHKGKLAGVFQVDTDTMKPFVTKMKPKNIKEISNIIALVRPGALDAPSPKPGDGRSSAEYYADCSIGHEKPYFIHSDLEPILGFSFGTILFQEQTLRIFNELGGLTLAEADIARRGMGKKDPVLLAKIMQPLIVALENKKTWTVEQIKLLTDTITASNRYSFNQAHSISYSIVSYECAYWKIHNPLYYWLGFLSINTDDHATLRLYLKEAGPYVLPVDLMKSHATDWVIEDGKLRAPMSLMKGCGDASMIAIRSLIFDDYENMEKAKPKKSKNEVVLTDEELVQLEAMEHYVDSTEEPEDAN